MILDSNETRQRIDAGRGSLNENSRMARSRWCQAFGLWLGAPGVVTLGVLSRCAQRDEVWFYEGWWIMGAQSDQVKGKVKEASGVLTGNKDLESEGKADRQAGEAKEKVADAKSKVDEAVSTVAEKAGSMIDKLKDVLHRK